MAELIDLASKRGAKTQPEIVSFFETALDLLKTGEIRSYSIILVTRDGNIVQSHYACSEVDTIAMNAFQTPED